MNTSNLPKQLLTLEDRKNLTLTGVSEIESSDDTSIKLKTNMGKVWVLGTNLSIGKINVESGEFSVSGQIKRIEYKSSSQDGKFSSLFK